MKLDNVKREQVLPVIPAVESVTITFTREEAVNLAHLVGSIGGSPDDFPQRRTYDKLFGILYDLKLAGSGNIGKSPLRFAETRPGADSLYLMK